MTLTYSAPAAYVFVFVCEKEQHFILEEVFKKEKKKDFEVLKNVFCVWSLSCGDLSLFIYVSCHGYLFLVYILQLIWATLLSPNVLTNRAGKVTFKM